jgi:hypothetical protein
VGLLEDLRSATNDSIVDIVKRLVDAGRREDDRLDYKEILTTQTDEQKLELAGDVSAFANAHGGWLVYGVRERRENGENTGEPEALVGLSGANPDKLERQLLDILDAHLQPRVPRLTLNIAGRNGGHLVVIGAPRRWNGPHMVKNGTFWVRQGARKRPYDVAELRSAFAGGGELEARVRRFKDERLQRIVWGDAPVQMKAAAFVVVHAIPFASIDGQQAVDLAWVEKNQSTLWPDSSLAQYWRSRFNIDGFVTALPTEKHETFEYVQVFRSGAMEYVDAYMLDAPKVDGCLAEARILRAIPP